MSRLMKLKIIVLFLFVVMLLNLKSERVVPAFNQVDTVINSLIWCTGFIFIFDFDVNTEIGNINWSIVDMEALNWIFLVQQKSIVEAIGIYLFTEAALVIVFIGLILLASLIGAIVITMVRHHSVLPDWKYKGSKS